ncbi:MAG: IS110 family transposase [Acidobacteriota bacterium]|jgi:transposase
MIIIGCDFHSRWQLIAMLDTETGEVVERRLDHESGEARRFYEGLKGPVLVGIEATGYTCWFAEMLQELGHELAVGESGKIRAMNPRKQKHDRRDAEHLLNLLMRGDFPKIWLPAAEERDVRVLIEHRHQLVELRTRAQNGLQAIALSYGLRRRRRLWSEAGQEKLQKLPLREGQARRRKDLTQLISQLNAWISQLDQRIREEVARRPEARRLMTHPGVGPQTALATVLVLGPAERFPDNRHLTSYLGLIPQEDSSAGRQRFGHLTKQGNRLMRFLLVEAAQTASRTDPRLQRAYRRLVFRKGKPIAKVAVARKLAIRLYIMLRDGIDYEEFCRRGPDRSGRGSHAGMLGDVALV